MPLRIFIAVCALVAFSGSCFGDLVMTSSNVPSPSSTFTDGSGDYFGVTDANGQIGGDSFSNLGSIPAGANVLAGEDLDGEGGSGVETATWSLSLPGDAVPGTGFTAIDFSGILAANESAWDDPDGIDIEFLIDGVSVDTLAFRNNDPDGFNGQLQETTSSALIENDGSSTINFSNAGGATVSNVSVVFTYTANSGNEEFWTTGTLTATYDQVMTAIPEPMTATTFVIGMALVARRRRA